MQNNDSFERSNLLSEHKFCLLVAKAINYEFFVNRFSRTLMRALRRCSCEQRIEFT